MMELAAKMPYAEYLIFNLPREVVVSPELRDRAIPVAGNLAISLDELASRFD